MSESISKHKSSGHKRIIYISVIFVSIAPALSLIVFLTGMRIGFLSPWTEEQYFGQIVEINESGITVADSDMNKREVVITADTKILQGKRVVTKESMLVGERVIIIGLINNKGQIDARVIRIFPNRKMPK